MKTWISFMCGENSLEDIREMYEPIRGFFDGICGVCFADRSSPEALYLEANKGECYITYLPYTGRHSLARNVAIHNGIIQDGDWVVQTDCLEHPQPWFLKTLAPLFMAEGRVNCCYYYGKPFLFQYHESLEYHGTPHENLTRGDGKMQAIELAIAWPDESKVRLNVRPLKRKDPLGWCLHYGRYYIGIPYGGNHCLLGNEHRGDPMKLYREREELRVRFRDYLRSKGVPLTLDGLRAFMDANPSDSVLIEAVNHERIINDLYRLWVMKDESIVDDHTWKGMIHLDSTPQSS